MTDHYEGKKSLNLENNALPFFSQAMKQKMQSKEIQNTYSKSGQIYSSLNNNQANDL